MCVRVWVRVMVAEWYDECVCERALAQAQGSPGGGSGPSGRGQVSRDVHLEQNVPVLAPLP